MECQSKNNSRYNQHHNRFFDKDHDKLYLYGGYGRHQYSGALYEYNLKDNFKWSQMNLDTLISPRYLSALENILIINYLF